MTYIDLIRKTALEQGFESSVVDVFANLMTYVEENRWQGACHPCSSALYVALRERGLDPRLCIGECRYGGDGIPFDHSWVEIDGKPFDVACAMRLDTGTPICAPVIGDIDVETGEPTEMRYGIEFLGLGQDAMTVYMVPFTDFMDGYPYERDGLWTVVGRCLGEAVDADELRRRYANVDREYVRCG